MHTYHTLYEQYATYVFPTQRMGSFFIGRLSKFRLRKADAIVAPTAKVETVLKNYGLHNPIHIVPTGIALEQHKQRITPDERKQLREKLGIPEDVLVLINLGRLGNEKNLDELIDFFAVARTHTPKLMLLIVGDGPARQELEEKVKDLGIDKYVIFTGMVKPEEVHSYYQVGDVFVSSSTSETQGLTYVEAAANGLPLLCRRDPCLDGVLVEGRNGFEYEAEGEFCDLIDTILQNPRWCRTAGSQSEKIANSFDKSCFAEKIEDVYQKVLL